MEKLWEEDSAHGRFWAQLLQENADQRMLDDEYLKRLRYRHDLAMEDQKRFGHIWARHNTNIYKLIASACGEVWDNEDEEKHQSASALEKTGCIPTKGNDNLDRTREESPRSRQHQFQGIPQAGFGFVEKGKGQSSRSKSSPGRGKGQSPEEETAAQEESRGAGGRSGTGGGEKAGP